MKIDLAEAIEMYDSLSLSSVDHIQAAQAELIADCLRSFLANSLEYSYFAWDTFRHTLLDALAPGILPTPEQINAAVLEVREAVALLTTTATADGELN